MNLQEQFRLDGFVSLSDYVNPSVVEDARREFSGITMIGFGERVLKDKELEADYPYALKLQEAARKFSALVLGSDGLPAVVQNQAVLRRANAPESVPYHIDGRRLLRDEYGSDWNRMPLMEIIVGIPLIDIPSRDCGNLAYLPGAHRKVGKFIHENWMQLSTMGDVWKAFEKLDDMANSLDRSTEKFTTTCVGDIYAMHAEMPHRVLLNGPERPVWYFRLGIPAIQGQEGFLWALKE